MAQVINTNVMALNAQRTLNRSQAGMQVSLERLSSGLRVNRAKDDAAGLAISERFTSQIRGLDQSVRNANDGISLLQTAEGALSEISTALQRMRELATQAKNGTNTASDRNSLQDEFNALQAEIVRISNVTEFNNLNLLGQNSGISLQVGWENGTNNVIVIDTADVKSAAAGGGISYILNSTKSIGGAAGVAGASFAMSAIDRAVDAISNLRGDFGALQNRLESAVRNMENVIENQSAARSRVLDADFARETANLTRTQILQQAGTAMLAQANQMPQNVLSLLR
jgi:flagellin